MTLRVGKTLVHGCYNNVQKITKQNHKGGRFCERKERICLRV